MGIHELVVNIKRAVQRLQNPDLHIQLGSLMEDPSKGIETDDEYLDDVVTKIMDSAEFKELVLPPRKRRTSIDTSHINNVGNAGNDYSEDDEISIIERAVELDNQDEVLDAKMSLTNDDVINRSINIFQESNMEQKMSIIDRLVKFSPLDVQQKILTHIFKIIQKSEKQAAKKSELGDKKTKDFSSPPGVVESECSICGAKVQSNEDLALHIKNIHGKPSDKKQVDNSRDAINTTVQNKLVVPNSDAPGSGFDMVAATAALKKISKICYICDIPIAGSGRGWRFPLYTHFSRKHFSRDLYRDFKTDNNKCSLCGKEEESASKLVAHLGATHKLVERYLDKEELSNYDRSGRSSSQTNIWEEKQKQLQLKLETNIYMTEHEILRKGIKHETSGEDIKNEISNESLEISNRKRRPAPSGNIPCHLCDKKLKVRSVLMSHLMVNHFKYDCEEAIKQVLEHSGDVCPLCPDRPQFTRPFDWKVFLHFSRTHKIAENLTYSRNELNFENVQKILQIFFP